MKTQTSFKRLILRAVLRKVSPMVIRGPGSPGLLDSGRIRRSFLHPSRLGWNRVQHSHARPGIHQFSPQVQRAADNAAGVSTAPPRDISLYLRRHRSLGMGGAAARLAAEE